ncbi:energy transducer TonB [Vibrio sp. JC009]|uniref:energy transducer TonB n=1 Tax=Vibrio sp. JC009 TaxID=2912314 RepID=UPI0023AFC9B3|nr:energy transducer TonB [Vibrio sp. JC009]WED23342.1 energy transducer TonB [Vibrio sp. JC009]
MIRLIVAFPLALAICYGLIGVMAWMVDLNTKPVRDRSEPLQFDIFASKKEQDNQRINRVMPEPPKLTPQLPKPIKLSQPQTQFPMETPALEKMPEIKMDLSVAGMSVSVPALAPVEVTAEKTVLQPADVPVQTGHSQQLIPLHRIEPVYPRKALLRKIEGYVVLSFDIDSGGKPENIEIIEAKPARIFNREALKALKRWKYQPQIVNGLALGKTGQKVKLEFKLQ